MKRRVVLLGPPASGKGTQSKLLFDTYQIPSASPGAMLREEKERQTPLGVRADAVTQEGQLLPDDVVFGLMAGWLARNSDGFVFDGFPRTLGQAESLDSVLEVSERRVEVAVALEAPSAALRARIAHRLVCSRCQETVALGWQVSTAEDTCPACGGSLIHRLDDCDEVFERRVVEYHVKTAPLLDYYEARSLLVRIEAARPAGVVFEDIQLALETP